MRIRLFAATAVIAMAVGCTMQTGPGYARVRAPEFAGSDADWLNSAPLSMKEIIRTHRTPDGKPVHAVLVDFWEYTCINCIRTLPYLSEWNRRYRDKGLLIVGIHTPEFAFAHDRANVADAVKRLGIAWPVLVDSDYTNWNAYANQYWPRHYLIDSAGYIVHDQAGEGGYGDTERRIQALLKKADPSLTFPAPMEPVRDTDKPGAVCYPVTPETYAGYARGGPGSPGGVKDRAAAYADPGEYEDGVPVLQGRWKATAEAVVHAGADPADHVAMKFHALDVYLVIKPETGAPYRVYVYQDGKPVAKADKGADIQYDEQGRAYIPVDRPRMYSAVHNARFGSHVLTLSSPSEGFGLYSYTFGSCTGP